MATLERRIEALETSHPTREPLLILRQIIKPGKLDAFPVGTLPAAPYLPAIDALPGEGWDDFIARLHEMIAHLPAGTVVRALSR